jgi:hypothetical protein
VLIAPASSQVSCFLGRDPERRDDVMCVCVWGGSSGRFLGIRSDMRESEVSLLGWALPLLLLLLVQWQSGCGNC